MLNRGSTEDFLMLTLQVHLFSKFPFGALTLKHGRQTKLVCLKKKTVWQWFFYVTVAAYFAKQGEIDRSSRLAIKNRWVVAKEIINLLKKISKLSDNHFLRFTGATYLDNILARPSFNAAFVSSPV